MFEWECRRLFDESWMCLGRAADLGARVGARESGAGSESYVVARDDAGAVRTFYNVCRHRGHELLNRGEVRACRVLQCPYHSWVYGLDGSLRGAPHVTELEGFDRAEHSLVPAHTKQWHGWLFVNASGDAEGLRSHTGSMGRLIAGHRPSELVTAARRAYEVRANWKIVTENYHECYHCPTIHPELCKISPPDSGANLDPDGAWVGGSMDLGDGMDTMSLDGRSPVGPLAWLPAGAHSRVFYFGLFPNLFISLHPDYVLTHRLEPVAPDRTRIECCWLFGRDAVETDGFDAGYAVEFWDITNRQDWSACEGVQRGVSSRGYRQGLLSPREDAIYHFETLIARSYLAGTVARPAPVVKGAPAGC